jgi:hypothetical protein
MLDNFSTEMDVPEHGQTHVVLHMFIENPPVDPRFRSKEKHSDPSIYIGADVYLQNSIKVQKVHLYIV